MRASSSLAASASPGTPNKTQDLPNHPEDWCWTTETHLSLFPQQPRDMPQPRRLGLCATIGEAAVTYARSQPEATPREPLQLGKLPSLAYGPPTVESITFRAGIFGPRGRHPTLSNHGLATRWSARNRTVADGYTPRLAPLKARGPYKPRRSAAEFQTR